MTKYYRVRTQEQWDWLKNKLEIKGDLHVSYFPVTILDGDVFCGIYKYHDDPEPLIEVSQMMEDEKTEDYVTIYGKDAERIRTTSDGQIPIVKYNELNGRLTPVFDIADGIDIPKSLLYPKVRMSVVEKKEFDWLKDNAGSLYYALDYIDEERYNRGTIPHLFDAIYGDNAKIKEIVFARAWADPSLIEVIPEDKYWVKCYPTDDCYFYKYEGKILAGVPRVHLERFQFTTDEIVEYRLDGTGNIFEKVEVSK